MALWRASQAFRIASTCWPSCLIAAKTAHHEFRMNPPMCAVVGGQRTTINYRKSANSTARVCPHMRPKAPVPFYKLGVFAPMRQLGLSGRRRRRALVPAHSGRPRPHFRSYEATGPTRLLVRPCAGPSSSSESLNAGAFRAAKSYCGCSRPRLNERLRRGEWQIR
jgi:hypothetical protein